MRQPQIQSAAHEAEHSRPVRTAMIFRLDPRKILIGHLYFIAFLIFCSVGTHTLNLVFDTRVVLFFSLDRESNLPTFFSTLMLFEATLLLFSIYTSESDRGGTQEKYWLILTLIFAAMAADETLHLHERLGAPIRSLLDLDGILHRAWVLPGSVFVLAVAGYFARFLMLIEKRIAKMFALCGVVYVTGALGLEFVGNYLLTSYGGQSLGYLAASTLEESLEMIGVAIFIFALLSLANSRGVHWAVVETTNMSDARGP